MVARMSSSIQATLIDEQRTLPVVSRALSLALQDLIQVAFFMSFVVIGWLLVSLFLRALGISAVTGVRKQKLASKLPEVVNAEESSEVVNAEDVERANPGLAILEHYGVFGCKPGAWTSGRSEKLPEVEESCKSPVTPLTEAALFEHCEAQDPGQEELETLTADQGAPLMARRLLGSRTPRGQSLLEQYGVFGVSPKCWRDTRIHGFGDLPELLTTIT